MRNGLTATLVITVFLAWAPAFAQEATFRLLAPSEEAFLGDEDVLLIAKVEGYHEAKMVEILDNSKTVGFAPLKKGIMTYRLKLSEGRHEVALTAPGVRRQDVKIFRGKQVGYRYHIEKDPASCTTCHSGAGKGEYAVETRQEELCLKCHDEVGTDEFIHGPVAAGSCSPCHDPHGSKNDFFLNSLGKELCMDCHSQNLSREHIEKRRNAECTKCHDPHSSAKNYHLH